MELIQLTFHVSWILILFVTLIAFGTHKYNDSLTRWAFVVYVVGSVGLMLDKSNIEKLSSFSALHFVLFVAVIVYGIGFIADHIKRKSRFMKLVNSRFGTAIPIFWSSFAQAKVEDEVDLNVLKSKKMFDSNDKKVFETRFDSEHETPFYYSDFYKEIQILEGEIQVVFKTGEIEVLTPEKKTAVRPYEVHKIKTISKCKLLVTCIC